MDGPVHPEVRLITGKLDPLANDVDSSLSLDIILFSTLYPGRVSSEHSLRSTPVTHDRNTVAWYTSDGCNIIDVLLIIIGVAETSHLIKYLCIAEDCYRHSARSVLYITAKERCLTGTVTTGSHAMCYYLQDPRTALCSTLGEA